MARAITLALPFWGACALSQEAPPSLEHPWYSAVERSLQAEGRVLQPFALPTDPDTPLSLRELIDLAETHNPETRAAWEHARAQAATLGIAQSELHPALAAAALSTLDH